MFPNTLQKRRYFMFIRPNCKLIHHKCMISPLSDEFGRKVRIFRLNHKRVRTLDENRTKLRTLCIRVRDLGWFGYRNVKGFKVLPESASKMRTLYTNALFLRKGSRFCQIWPQKSEPFACFCQIWPQKSEPFACRPNSPSPPAPQTPFREPLKKNPVLGTFPGTKHSSYHI